MGCQLKRSATNGNKRNNSTHRGMACAMLGSNMVCYQGGQGRLRSKREANDKKNGYRCYHRCNLDDSISSVWCNFRLDITMNITTLNTIGLDGVIIKKTNTPSGGGTPTPPSGEDTR